MSEKRNKEQRNTIDIPIYDIESQINYLIQICKDFDFNPQNLLSLIIADWIYSVQKGLKKGMDIKDIFITYLESVQKTRKNFDKLKKELRNE